MSVSAMLIDENDMVYAGTISVGLVIFNPKKNTWIKLNLDPGKACGLGEQGTQYSRKHISSFFR